MAPRSDLHVDSSQGFGPSKRRMIVPAAVRPARGARRKTLEIKFMSRFAFIVAAILSFSSGPAAAEEKMVVDMSKLTCGELTKLGFQDFSGVTMWLSGYYNSSIRNGVIDLYEFAGTAKKVKDFCQTNARTTVMSAAERALGIKMPR
ncbi:HdeA/HdeB family chaperone [Bradyrhizobium sp.]